MRLFQLTRSEENGLDPGSPELIGVGMAGEGPRLPGKRVEGVGSLQGLYYRASFRQFITCFDGGKADVGINLGTFFLGSVYNLFQLQGNITYGSVRRQVNIQPGLTPVRNGKTSLRAQEIPDIVDTFRPIIYHVVGNVQK